MSLDRCHQAALRLLSYRFRSREELRRRLVRRGFESVDIEATLTRLAEGKWLDDGRFAVDFARVSLRKRRGRNRVERELVELGIGPAAAREAVTEALGEEPEEQHLAAACRKKMQLLIRRHGDEFIESDEGRNKLVAYLLNQGYDYGAVAEVVKKEASKR